MSDCKNILALFVIGRFKDDNINNLHDFNIHDYKGALLNSKTQQQITLFNEEEPEEFEKKLFKFEPYIDTIMHDKYFKYKELEPEQKLITIILKKYEKRVKGIYRIFNEKKSHVFDYDLQGHDNDTKEKNIISIINKCFPDFLIEKIKDIQKRMNESSGASKNILTQLNNKKKEIEQYDKEITDLDEQIAAKEEEYKKIMKNIPNKGEEKDEIIEQSEKILEKQGILENKRTENENKRDNKIKKITVFIDEIIEKQDESCGKVNKLEISKEKKKNIVKMIKNRLKILKEETTKDNNVITITNLLNEEVQDIFSFVKMYLRIEFILNVNKYDLYQQINNNPQKSNQRFRFTYNKINKPYNIYTNFNKLYTGNVEQEAKIKEIFKENKINVKYVWNGDILKYTDAKRFNEKEKKEYNEKFIETLQIKVINKIIEDETIYFNKIKEYIVESFEDLLINRIKCEIKSLESTKDPVNITYFFQPSIQIGGKTRKKKKSKKNKTRRT